MAALTVSMVSSMIDFPIICLSGKLSIVKLNVLPRLFSKWTLSNIILTYVFLTNTFLWYTKHVINFVTPGPILSFFLHDRLWQTGDI